VQYEKAFFDSSNADQMAKLNWTDPKQFFVGGASRKRKSMVLVDSEWCNACKVMRRTTFSDTVLADYLSKNFELVELNALATDNYTYQGQQLAGAYNEQVPFSKLSMALCRNNLVLPMLVVLDEQDAIIDAVPFYIHPRFLKDISRFYGENIYKSKNWQEYMKEVYGQ
jgi:thioredoxin-related protein